MLLVAVLGISAPLFGSSFFVNFVLTRTLILGIAAASLIFLSAYGGMVSLSQFLIAGVAAFAVGNAVTTSGNGLHLGWNPWLGMVTAIALATIVAVIFGALSSRTTGIYFLMLTMTFSVIGYYFFSQVTTFSGAGGVSGVRPPPVFDKHPSRIYYAALVLSALTYAGFRYVIRSPFGLAMQGVRDDPVRMAALGFNVSLHRTIAFAFAGFVSAIAGVLYVWWNGQIDPKSIAIAPTLSLLIIAVIGGISRLEGAWLGAFTFVAANSYIRLIPLVDKIGITPSRFNTLIGALVVLIMVLSPEGLVGIFSRRPSKQTFKK